MRIKKKHLKLFIAAFAVIVLVIIAIALSIVLKPKPWYVDANDYVHFTVEPVDIVGQGTINTTANWTEDKVVFKSHGANIYGLLFYHQTPAPGVLLLPGGAVKKEDEARTAIVLANMGYTVLTIDQRGIGETGGYYPSLEQDYSDYTQGQEPVQQLQVYDALVSAQVLRQSPHVSSNKIIYMGESMGGRVAAVASALDPQKAAVVLVSTDGFETQNMPSTAPAKYLATFDPDHYIQKISPTPLLMMHSVNDTTIPIASARELYSRAQEPKTFVAVNETYCGHGYCGAMTKALKEFLANIEK